MILSRKEIELLERVAAYISNQEMESLLDPFNHREATAFLYRLGKALGIDTRPSRETAAKWFYEPSNLDRDTEETGAVLVQVWRQTAVWMNNQPRTVEARPKRKVVKAFKSWKIDTETFEELIARFRK